MWIEFLKDLPNTKHKAGDRFDAEESWAVCMFGAGYARPVNGPKAAVAAPSPEPPPRRQRTRTAEPSGEVHETDLRID